MEKKDILDCVNPDRREFVKKIATAAFVVPVVVSVTMAGQKLDVSTANASSALPVPAPAPAPAPAPGPAPG